MIDYEVYTLHQANKQTNIVVKVFVSSHYQMNRSKQIVFQTECCRAMYVKFVFEEIWDVMHHNNIW